MNDETLRRKIAALASDSSRVILLPHAASAMRRRGVLFTQVLKVLARGRVVEHAHRDIYGNWKCTLEALTAGDRIKVAAALSVEDSETVIVITVMN